MKRVAGSESGRDNAQPFRRTPAALAVILPLLLLGPGPCNLDRTAGPVPPVKPTTGLVTLDWGESILIQPENFTITFMHVLSDSRCPIGVQCIWEGMDHVELSLQKGSGLSITFTLSDHDMESLLDNCCWQESEVWGLTFRYQMLVPYPISTIIPDSTDFSLQLDISR